MTVWQCTQDAVYTGVDKSKKTKNRNTEAGHSATSTLGAEQDYVHMALHTSQIFGKGWFGNYAGENSEVDASYVEKGSTSGITKGAGPQPHPHDPVVVYAEVNKSKGQRKGKTDIGSRATTTLGVQPEEQHYEFGSGHRNLAGIKPETIHGDMEEGGPYAYNDGREIGHLPEPCNPNIHWLTKV